MPKDKDSTAQRKASENHGEKKDAEPVETPVVRVPPTTKEELERARKIGAMP